MNIRNIRKITCSRCFIAKKTQRTFGLMTISPVKLDIKEDFIPVAVPSKIEFARIIIAIEKEINKIITKELFLERIFLKANFNENTIVIEYCFSC